MCLFLMYLFTSLNFSHSILGVGLWRKSRFHDYNERGRDSKKAEKHWFKVYTVSFPTKNNEKRMIRKQQLWELS